MAIEDHIQEDGLWYKDAIIYEVHVKSFYDSNGDGIGDLQGLIEKLDYLKDLGVTAVWLLPFYPSPLKDDGYDITDYLDIHPDYGDLKTFRRFLKEAHLRGLKVITEMVLNHTSDRHPWFQKARKSKPGSVWRNFYVWSDTPDKYRETRVIFKDFETSNWAWDPVARSYYWHRFYSHQPDLNFDNPHVQRAMIRVIDFWLRMGVDGIRLDAVPYLYEREGTNCENLPETHGFLVKLRSYIDSKFKNKMLLAESNQWPEDAAAYFGKGDECHMAFHFPLMPRMFMAIEMEDRFPITNIMDQTPQIPASCQWALFLRNHDELTLEMVTDEERDYMYRVYATDPRTKINLGIRRRLAPLLGNNRRKIELMFLLLFSLPGTPVVYYGDEIGMGDNYYLGDRNGVRTPMQWNPDLNAGFSFANPQELYLPVIIDPQYHYGALNVANQERDSSSLLWWMKQMISLRKRLKAFGRGDMKILFPSNSKVMAFIRHYEEETILIIANLSKYPQQTEIDLSEYAGSLPEELLSRSRFHEIEKSPYTITFGPYYYYTFLLVQKKEQVCATKNDNLSLIEMGKWSRLADEKTREKLEDILLSYLQCMGLSGEDGRELRSVQILESTPISASSHSHLLFLKIYYAEGPAALYLLPLSFASGDRAETLKNRLPQSLIARINIDDENVIAYDGTYDDELRGALLSLILRGKKIRDSRGNLVFYSSKPSCRVDEINDLTSKLLKSGKSTVHVQFKDLFIMKLYKLIDTGGNYEIEMTRFLTEKGFRNILPFCGAIEYRHPKTERLPIGMLQRFVPHEGDAWNYSLDEAGRYFERVLAKKQGIQEPPKAPESLLKIEPENIPPLIKEMLGGIYLEMVQLLGMRTGEMHLALASSEDPDFAPVPFTAFHQQSLYQSMRVSVDRTFFSLGRHMKDMPEDVKGLASKVFARETEIQGQMKMMTQRKLNSSRIRIHGDYQLDQLLYTGKDFIIYGFDHDQEHALIDRRLKRSPLVDVSSLIMSFHSAASTALFKHASARKEDLPLLEPWKELWFKYVSGIFISAYIKTVKDTGLLPTEEKELEAMFNAFLMERAVFDLGKSLAKPGSLIIPLQGIIYLLAFIKKGNA